MRDLIKKYVDKIDVYDIILFGEKNGITVDKDEGAIILKYLKNNWEELIYGNPLPIIQRLQNEIGKTKCEKMSELLYYYKDKYKDYL